MALKVPRLLLFDIDGTLTKSCHVGQSGGSSLLEALSKTFECPILRKDVVFSGGTDPSISKDVLLANNITSSNCSQFDAKLEKSLSLLPDLVKTGIEEKRFSWKALGNVNELLKKLSLRSDVQLALLTGNVHDTAFLKLQSAGVDSKLFTIPNRPEKLFGAFGSDHGTRSELVKIAQQRYANFLGHNNITPNDMVVIGDSPRDIDCAHANNVPCVAVATGVFMKQSLAEAEFVLEDGFSDIDLSIRAILNTKRN